MANNQKLAEKISKSACELLSLLGKKGGGGGEEEDNNTSQLNKEKRKQLKNTLEA